jgi:hypothetical protein
MVHADPHGDEDNAENRPRERTVERREGQDRQPSNGEDNPENCHERTAHDAVLRQEGIRLGGRERKSGAEWLMSLYRTASGLTGF